MFTMRWWTHLFSRSPWRPWGLTIQMITLCLGPVPCLNTWKSHWQCTGRSWLPNFLLERHGNIWKFLVFLRTHDGGYWWYWKCCWIMEWNQIYKEHLKPAGGNSGWVSDSVVLFHLSYCDASSHEHTAAKCIVWYRQQGGQSGTHLRWSQSRRG
jgi:hypothetical protein